MPEPGRGVFHVEHIFELVHAENQGNTLQGPHQFAQPLNDPVRRVGVGAGNNTSQELAVVGREILAAQVLENASLDPWIVVLEIEQGLGQVNVN